MWHGKRARPYKSDFLLENTFIYVKVTRWYLKESDLTALMLQLSVSQNKINWKANHLLEKYYKEIRQRVKRQH